MLIVRFGWFVNSCSVLWTTNKSGRNRTRVSKNRWHSGEKVRNTIFMNPVMGYNSSHSGAFAVKSYFIAANLEIIVMMNC